MAEEITIESVASSSTSSGSAELFILLICFFRFWLFRLCLWLCTQTLVHVHYALIALFQTKFHKHILHIFMSFNIVIVVNENRLIDLRPEMSNDFCYSMLQPADGNVNMFSGADQAPIQLDELITRTDGNVQNFRNFCPRESFHQYTSPFSKMIFMYFSTFTICHSSRWISWLTDA